MHHTFFFFLFPPIRPITNGNHLCFSMCHRSPLPEMTSGGSDSPFFSLSFLFLSFSVSLFFFFFLLTISSQTNNQKEEKIRNCHPEIFRLGVEEPRWHPDLPCMPLDSRSAALIIGIQIYRTCGRNPDLLLIQPTSRFAMFLLREEQVVGRHDGH